MKNKLLITTAIVAAFGVTDAMAEDVKQIVVEKDQSITIDKNIDGFSNTGDKAFGAVWSKGATVKVADGIVFSNNSLDKESGAAITNGVFETGGTVGGTLEVGNNVQFIGNTSTYGGAVYNNKGNMTFGNGVRFEGNKSTKNEGGALALDVKGKTTFGEGAKFINNESEKAGGGAINIYTDTASGGELNGLEVEFAKNALFKGNKAAADGGAIRNKGGKLTLNGANFEGNSAEVSGGAIYNDKADLKSTLNISSSTFTNNTAGTAGGAIFNAADNTINFSGNNVFSGNKAGENANDIHNDGTINVAEGSHLTLEGGISGTGTTTFADGSHLTVKAGTTTISNTVKNNGASMDMVFANGFAGKDGYELVEKGKLDNEFNILNEDNGLFTIEKTDTNGTYNVVKKSTSEIAEATGANANQANAITAITSGNSENATFNAVADGISTKLQSSNASERQEAVNAVTAMSAEAAPMVQQNSVETTNQVFSAIGTRLSGAGVSSSAEGMSSGDNVFERAAMWVQGLFNKSKLDDTSKAKGFDADSNGIAMGAEKYINDNTKVGLGYAYTNTDIDGFLRTTDVDTHTAFVYGEYKPSNWYVNGIASYGWSDYSENKNVLGNSIDADYDVDTFGLQAMTGYDIKSCDWTLTPEAGLRYVHLKQDSYTDTAGSRVSGNESDILTGVIGAKVAKDWTLNNGMKLKPEARVAMTYDLMNDDANSVMSLANGAAYSVEGEALDRFGMEFGAGVTAEVNEKVELSVGYEGKFREDYQDHTGLLNAKYKF